MRWEITRNTTPENGDVRFVTKFAWLPTRVLSKITFTDHMIWLELYVEEQQYLCGIGFDGEIVGEWQTVGKTIHV